MSGNSELLQAMQMFGQGLKEYHQTQAVEDARAQLNAINTQVKDAGDKQAAISSLGQDLALRLTAAHADQGQIAAAVERLTPSATVVTQSQYGLAGEKMKQAGETEREKMKNETAIKTHQMSLDAAQGKLDKKTATEMNGQVDKFGKMPQVKPYLEGIPKLQKAIESINSNDGKFGINSAIELAKLGVIRDSAGRVNEKEIEAANESASVREQLWKRSSLAATGQPPKDVTEFWKRYLNSALETSQAELHKAAEGHADSIATMFPNANRDQLSSAIHQRYGIKKPEPKSNPNQARIEQLKSALADPKNANHPRRAEAEAELQKLQQAQP